MDKEISPATQECIRKLCGQITVAHDLDPEIQEELSGHLEDKLHAYLAGEEALSEEDAYMLTRRHFGDVSALKVLLQNVHDRSVCTGLARRLTAALVAAVSLSILTGIVSIAARVALALWAVQTDAQYDSAAAAGIFLRDALGLPAVIFMWYLFARWQRQLTEGCRPWFIRWSSRRMWAVAAAALIAPQVMPALVTPLSQGTQHIHNPLVSYLLGAMEIAPVLLSAFAWLWWCDRRPRAAKGLLGAAVGWALLQINFVLSPRLVPVVLIGFEPASYAGKHVDTLVHGTFLGTSLHWSLTTREALRAAMIAGNEKLQEILPYMTFINIAAMAIAAVLALAIYGTLRFASTRIARRGVRRQACA